MRTLAPKTPAEIKQAAKAHFAEAGLGPDDETRIALFLQAIKTANTLMLAKVETRPLNWWAYRFLHDQYFKEAELATMLARTARWTLNPKVYLEASANTALLWQAAGIAGHILTRWSEPREFFEYLALSHALLAEIRFIALFPTTWDLTEPFLYTLNEIEEENGRQIQAQIRLLNDLKAPALSAIDRERIVDAQRRVIVDLFAKFLTTLLPQAG